VSDEARALRAVLADCLALRAGETFIAVTDPRRRRVAELLLAGARDLGADAVLVEMGERAGHGIEPPGPVAAALLACDAFVAPTTKSLSHTEARRAACARGARGATMPGITYEMLVRTMSADHAGLRRRARALASILTAGDEVRVTSAEGTDVAFSIRGREATADDGDLSRPGAFGNLPAGEAFVAPVEGATRGRIVFDGATAALGEPLVVTIDDGYAAAWEGRAGDRFEALAAPHGRDAFAVAELGIGVNDNAKITGALLEDEKVLGTVHVAFGDNHSFGGVLRVDFHHDFVVRHPHVTVDGRTILSAGELKLQ
jgi:leucyl aminopeptidase (aminopeptidase T)